MHGEELLEAMSWVLRSAIEAEVAEYEEPPEVDPVENLADCGHLDRDRVRLIFAGEEDPTLTEFAAILRTLDIGWGEFGRRLRRWASGQNGAPYQAQALAAMEVTTLERRIDERLQSMEDRLRRLEGTKDAAGS